jgi:hypothetical protein
MTTRATRAQQRDRQCPAVGRASHPRFHQAKDRPDIEPAPVLADSPHGLHKFRI